MNGRFPPWLTPTWEQLSSDWRQGRLAHALLLSGADGLGKRRLAERLAALLLCEHPADTGQSCGHCQACLWLQAGAHPDLRLLQPEEAGKAIKIDQVRALSVELAMTSYSGHHKVALVAPADALNVNAANGLLKTLEEPTADTVLILLSASPGSLPATVRSRCRHLRVHRPDSGAGLDWMHAEGIADDTAQRCLQVAGGAPLAAVELAAGGVLAERDRRLAQLAGVFRGRDDPLRVAADWLGEHEARTLGWWRDWLQALVRWQQAGLPPDEPQVAQTLQQISESVDCRQVFELSDRIVAALHSLGSGLNRQLLLEDLLIDWARLARTRRSAAPVT